MLKNRVIPFLLIKNGGLVKSRQFQKHRYVGDPINAIKIFNEKEVDELVVLDIDASREKRGPNFQLIEEMAGEAFIPLCYGGGISHPDQARQLFALGIEKVCLQTHALHDLDLINKIATKHGRSSVVMSLDIKRDWLGRQKLYSASAGQNLPENWEDFLKKAVEAGAGEIVINSVDRDGTLEGMDLSLIKKASQLVKVPTIAVGGVGKLEHIKQAIDAGASAVGAGSFFVFHGPHQAVLITYPRYQELETLLRP